MKSMNALAAPAPDVVPVVEKRPGEVLPPGFEDGLEGAAIENLRAMFDAHGPAEGSIEARLSVLADRSPALTY